MLVVATRINQFRESVITQMTQLSDLHGAVNMAQGFPDFGPPEPVAIAAREAIDHGLNQYDVTCGAQKFRDALAAKMRWYNRVDYDADYDITVTCGSTEAMAATLLAVVNPGDEVIAFEPAYENYEPNAIIAGGQMRYVRLDLDDPQFSFDPSELTSAITASTRALIVNTPHNPTGKVFSRAELDVICDLCLGRDLLVITDEVYEHIVFDTSRHISIASLPRMAERTVTIGSLSKTYSVTGWRVGWAVTRNRTISAAIRRAHDYLTVGAPVPFQYAGVQAVMLPRSYYGWLVQSYKRKRDVFTRGLTEAGLRPSIPQGTFYTLAEVTQFGFETDEDFAREAVKAVGVACLPASAFLGRPERSRQFVRFSFAKSDEILEVAAERLARLVHLRA